MTSKLYFRLIPLQLFMLVIAAVNGFISGPFTGFFIKDTGQPVYQMTVDAFRMLPFAMPFSVFVLSFVTYGQTSGKQAIVHLETLLDGVVCVAGFTALLIGPMGMKGFYLANILNGVVTVAVFFIYSCLKRKSFPKNMEDLMVIPPGFGFPPEDRIDITINDMDGVLRTADRIQRFLLDRGTDRRRAYYGALCMEEMAGNIVKYGFNEDSRPHTIDIRAAVKGDTMILRIKDDCKAFDPTEREKLAPDDDVLKDIGIRMVYRIADDVSYNHTLGLNVLTIRIKI
ncbi:MAG: ATP-binding protein [Eubacterium sp.]|nr:ATP-binding protein [Eubacterium sp.]